MLRILFVSVGAVNPELCGSYLPVGARGGLESVAAATAEAAAGEAAATAEGGALGAARSGGHDVACHRRHVIQIVGEHVGIEARAVAALIPLRGLGVDTLEGLAPVFFDAECHGEGKKLFEHFRGFDSAVEAIGFYVSEKILEAEDSFQGARSSLGVRGHEPTEAADNGASEESGNDKRQRLHAGVIGDPDSAGNQDETDDDAEPDVGRANTVRPLRVVSIANQRREDLIPDAGDIRVEGVMQSIERDGVTGVSGAEDSVEKFLLVGLEGIPLGA